MSRSKTFLTPNFISLMGLISKFHNDPSYSKIFRFMKKEKRFIGNDLPISTNMVYKRVFQLKKMGFAETRQAKVFPSFATVHLTDRAIDFIKNIPILFTFLQCLPKKEDESKKIDKPCIPMVASESRNQSTLSYLVKKPPS